MSGNFYPGTIGAVSMLLALAMGESGWVGILLGVLITTAVLAIRDQS